MPSRSMKGSVSCRCGVKAPRLVRRESCSLCTCSGLTRGFRFAVKAAARVFARAPRREMLSWAALGVVPVFRQSGEPLKCRHAAQRCRFLGRPGEAVSLGDGGADPRADRARPDGGELAVIADEAESLRLAQVD